MKPYERRAQQSYPYYKLATWDAVSMTWRDGKVQFATRAKAFAAATSVPGRYRISEVTETGRTDGTAFATDGSPTNCY